MTALRRPLVGRPLPDLVAPGTTVVIVFPDITRPMPNRVVLPPLLAELERLGAGPHEVTLLCSTGTHRPATAEELAALVGPDILARYAVHQHVATDGDHVEVGTVDGTPVLLDRRYVAADVRIVTGFVEPHFFAGFSGGPKAVCPGVAALETILAAHSPARILHPRSTWTELDANPVHRFIARAAALLPPDLSVDVAINSAREVTAAFVGTLPGAHREACAFVRRTAVHTLPAACDIVISSNAGLPLDRNLYQTVKGMAAAERVVRPGGDIVILASCVDGYPDEGAFARIIRSATSAAALTDPDVAASQDTWQTQVFGRVLSTATVHLYTEGLSADQVRAAHLRPVEDPSATVAELLGRRGTDATVCLLPEGPLTVATVAGAIESHP
ncbi:MULTISPECIES: nickel-dependent lactate racemase [Pseudofrankia]|uniref:nickel-dependent lactate racemase n=1 Tax=Pseudofrankia TaxID=2994363 RepID=UPI000234B79D|nr:MULTISPECIES: nickel-dependent lactate racemase [Pseudofrankia]